MLRWLPRITIMFLFVCALGIFGAYAIGSALNHDVLVLSTTPNGTGNTKISGFYDIDNRLNVRFRFPLDDIWSSIMWNSPREFLLMTQSDVLNPEANLPSQQEHQYGLFIYNLDQEQTWPLLQYTDSGRRRISSFNLYNDLYPIVNMNDQLMGLYDNFLHKLFIYDRAESYQLLHTIHLETFLRIGSTPNIHWSHIAQKFAIVYDRNTLLIMNLDGSDRQYFHNEHFDDFYPLWSPNGDQILLVPQNSTMNPMTVLDVNTGEWRFDLERIIGRSPQWMCKGQWIRYETRGNSSSEAQTHLLHVASGRIVHFSDHPMLDAMPINNLWSPDCEHIIIVSGSRTTNIADTTKIYVTTFDLAEVRLISEMAMTNFIQTNDGYIQYRIRTDIAVQQIWREPLNGSSGPELVGTLPSQAMFISSSFDNGQKVIFMDYSRGYNNAIVNVLDLNTGEMTPLNDYGEGVANANLLYFD